MERVLFLYKKWCEIPDKIRFLLIGAINAGISYLIFVLSIFILGESFYQICVAFQWVLSSVFSFINQKVFVFCTKGNWFKEYFKCCTTWFISYILNVVILEVLVKFVRINVYIAQIISIFSVAIVTYVLFKYFAFKQPKKI